MASVANPAAGIAGLLVMTYDVTGRATAHMEGWPLIGWGIDETNPIDPKPITVGNPLAIAPPTTGMIISPAWALIVSDDAIYVPDEWRGNAADFFMWLATNNGASRKLSAWFTLPSLLNIWNIWVREHPDLVT